MGGSINIYSPKIERNIIRDRNNGKELYKEGWKVVRFWQQQIIKDTPKCIKKIKTEIHLQIELQWRY